MVTWPVPSSYSKKLPSHGGAGSFLEKRDGKLHAGCDIYAPLGSEVLSIGDGSVKYVGIATSPEEKTYWNRTYMVVILSSLGYAIKYSELKSVFVEMGQEVKDKQKIGEVGQVLNFSKIGADAPKYIKDLKEKGNASMLHLEVHAKDYLSKRQFNTGIIIEMDATLIDPSYIFH